MGATEKCNECRIAKVKCLPEDRIWDPDSDEPERCTHCLKGNRKCGPNTSPPERTPRPRQSQVRINSYASSVTLSADFHMGSEYTGARSDSSGIAGVYTTDNSMELKARLEDLDADAELANRVHLEIEIMENRVVHGSRALICTPEYYKGLDLKHATSQSLLTRLDEVGTLAARAHVAGQMDLAENAYNRMLEIYKRQPSPSVSLIHSLLTKMASFYWNSDQPLRAEKCWREILELRDSTGKHLYVGTEVWESLKLASLRTSGLLANACKAHYPELYLPLNLNTPFPFIHTLIRSEYPSEKRDKDFGNKTCSENMILPGFHKATAGGARSLSEIIKRMSDDSIDDCLRARDIMSRTPLYMAAFHKREDAGNALIARISNLSEGHQEMHINARDLSGQTVLGIAILSACSLAFIKALIRAGSPIDIIPCQYAATPLQAASMSQRADVVRLFLKCRADLNRVYPGNPTALKIAETLRNKTIVQLINNRSSLLPYGTTRGNFFEEDGHESSPNDISDFSETLAQHQLTL